jgi:hypothetical protein
VSNRLRLDPQNNDLDTEVMGQNLNNISSYQPPNHTLTSSALASNTPLYGPLDDNDNVEEKGKVIVRRRDEAGRSFGQYIEEAIKRL